MSTDIVMGQVTTNTVVVYPNIQEVFKHIKPPKKTKVATGCSLCDKIWSSEKAYENLCSEKNAIVMDGDEYGLYVPCEDDYYSGIKMHISFCPKCGRRLAKNDEM